MVDRQPRLVGGCVHFSRVVSGGVPTWYSASSRVVPGALGASRDFEQPRSVRRWYGTTAAPGRAKRVPRAAFPFARC